MCIYSRSHVGKEVSETHHKYILTVTCNKINELTCSVCNTEEELGLACLVSSDTLPHQNLQPGRRGQQTACSKVLSRHAKDT